MSPLDNLQFSPPASRLSPQISISTFALVTPMKELSLSEQAAVYDSVALLPGGVRERSADLFQATWGGLIIGLALGVGGMLVFNHFTAR